METSIYRGIIPRFLVWILVVGLVGWGPGVSAGWAQLEAKTVEECREILANDTAIAADPELKEEVAKVLDDLEEAATSTEPSEEAQQTAEAVETTATTLAEARTTVAQTEVPSTEALTEALTAAASTTSGPTELSAATAQELAQKVSSTMQQVKEALASGNTLEAAAAAEGLQKELAKYGIDSGALAERCGALGDITLKDTVGGTMREHFESSLKELASSGQQGEASKQAMGDLAKEMVQCGVDPRAVLDGAMRDMQVAGAGAAEGFHPEGMTMDSSAMREMMTSQMETQIKEMGPVSEAQAREMMGAMEGQFREVMMHEAFEKISPSDYTADANFSTATVQGVSSGGTGTASGSGTGGGGVYGDGHTVCPDGKTHAIGVAGSDPTHCQ